MSICKKYPNQLAFPSNRCESSKRCIYLLFDIVSCAIVSKTGTMCRKNVNASLCRRLIFIVSSFIIVYVHKWKNWGHSLKKRYNSAFKSLWIDAKGLRFTFLNPYLLLYISYFHLVIVILKYQVESVFNLLVCYSCSVIRNHFGSFVRRNSSICFPLCLRY